MKKRKFLDLVLSAFFPSRCEVCGEVIEMGRDVCDKCNNEIFPITGEVCHKCGVGLSSHSQERCREMTAPVIAAYYYKDTVRNLIINFKETKNKKYFERFSLAFYEKIASEYCDIDFDLAVCVPSKSEKKTTSSIICKETAKRFLIDCDISVLEKYRQTEKQHRLNMAERFNNLENSIRVRRGKEALVKDKTILLFDDVKTTGTTLSECAKALYNSGAKAVYSACLAVSDYSTIK